ncbi:MAG: deoxyribodipyrimidine photo-lyase [Parachlamydiaceae bacterium]|nr:deoxyribodipyrimidine photo-lyase [Parachlamydiaceae bacterium]
MLPLTIVWLSQSLRIEDNPALFAACNAGAVLPVYIYSTDQGDWPLGGASRWWLHYALEDLKASLDAIGLPLIIRQGEALTVLQHLIAESGATTVAWNRRYEPFAIEQEARVKLDLLAQNITVQTFNASLLFEPWTISNKQGKPFQVFTPYWKACLASPSPEPPLPVPKVIHPIKQTIHSDTLESLHLLPRIHWDEGIKQSWIPGATEAKKLLSRFLKEGIASYKEQRDRPDVEGISRLSPYLHFGEISPRMIWHAVHKAFSAKPEISETYLRQLGWREFAYHLLYHFPETPEQPLRTDFRTFPWNENPEQLKAWQKGLTGYPFVDAGMRQLWTTGWMHNRVRMVVGSFLVKHLLLNWVEGAYWFWDTLVDADLANNTMGWQWVGGCGADAAPYFRIFNPITQGEKFDPEGKYVREWIPELALLPNEWIHRPWEAPETVLQKAGVVLGKTYPKPIVDHGKARERALEAFAAMRDGK